MLSTATRIKLWFFMLSVLTFVGLIFSFRLDTKGAIAFTQLAVVVLSAWGFRIGIRAAHALDKAARTAE